MSELNETAGEQGNAGADGSAQPSSAPSAEQSAGSPDTSLQSGGSEADAGKSAAADGTAGDATAADGSNAPEGEQGNAAAGESQSSQPCLDSGESTLGGELPNGADTSLVGGAIGAAGEYRASFGVDWAKGESIAPLTQRVEAAALHAYQSGNTSEHNLMAWLHTHLTGAKAATAGAESLEGLTPEAKSILADLKTLL
jgi:hypothetical protein